MQTVVSPKEIDKLLLNYGETLRSIYTPQEINFLRRTSRVLAGQQAFASELINNPILKSIVSGKSIPARVVNVIVRPGDTTNIKTVRRLLGEKAVNELRKGFTGDFLALNQQGNFQGVQFAKNFNKYGRATLEELYGKQTVKEMETLATVGSRMGGAERLAGPPHTNSQNTISFLTGAAMVSHPFLTAGAIVTLRGLASLYLSQAGRSLFVKGLSTPLLSAEAGPLASRLLSVIATNETRNLREELSRR